MAGDYPIGFRFRPTEEELISLLWRKVTNEQQQEKDDIVVEKTIYGEDALPWNVFGDDSCWESFDDSGKKCGKRMLYVFTQLSKISSKKIARTAGCGTWDGQTKGKDVVNCGGEVIGSMKMFNYVLNSGSPRKGGWIMHEYSLAGAFLDWIGSTDHVICRIIRDDEKYTKVKKAAAAANQEVDRAGPLRCTPQNPKVLGKRTEPSFQQENSQQCKMTRNTSMDAADFATVSTNGTIHLPNHLANHEGHVISHQVMCDEVGMNPQTTYTDLFLEGTQPISLIGLDRHDFESSQYAQQPFDQHQLFGEISNCRNAALIPVEIEQTHSRLQEQIDSNVHVVASQGSEEESIVGEKENSQTCKGNSEAVTNGNKAAEPITDFNNSEQSLEMHISTEKTSSEPVDCGGDKIIYQEMENDLFNEDFLQSFGGDDEDTYAQQLIIADEWFQDALPIQPEASSQYAQQPFDQHQHIGEIPNCHSTAMEPVEIEQDGGLIQPEACSQYAQQPFDQQQHFGEISNCHNAAMLPVEIEQRQSRLYDPIDFNVHGMARQGSEEESTIDENENLQSEGTLEAVTSVNKNAETITNFNNSEQSFEVQISAGETSSNSVDYDDDKIIHQAMDNGFFNQDFLQSFEGDDEDIYSQPLTIADEWFQDALQCL